MNEGVSSSLIGVDGLKFEDINQCQTEANDDNSSDKNSENDLEEEWYSQLKSLQIDTLSLQRKFSSEFKSCSSLTSSPPTSPSPSITRRLLRRQAKPTVVAPKNKIEKQVVDFKSQLLSIEALINANEPKPENYYPNREELKSKIKSRQKKVRSADDHMDPVELRSKPPRSTRKSPAPPPPSPQQQPLQTDLIAPKIVITKQSDSSPSSSSSPFTVRRPSSFGIQWKKMQNSKSVKFLTDSSPIRKNFRGFRKAFKSSEDVVANNNDNSDNQRLSDALVTFSMEKEIEEKEDYLGRKILKNLHLENSKINREYLSELVDVLAKQIDSDFSSESSDSDDEEVISVMALREIATFEKLIEDYKQDLS